MDAQGLLPSRKYKFRYSNAGSCSLIPRDVVCSRHHRHQLLEHERRSPVAQEYNEFRLRTSLAEDRAQTLYFERAAPSPLEMPTLNHCHLVLCLPLP